ncbi:MAG: hypothetical protein EBT92_17590 [Planctomycetes bacterium]|nr:hypothetical protein [Planctomycetota bacterium]
MKIENLNKALQLAEQLKQVDKAITQLSIPLTQFTTNSPNWGISSETALYQLHMTQYQDGSGFKVDLTGCCVGLEVLKYAEQLLIAKRRGIQLEIKSL